MDNIINHLTDLLVSILPMLLPFIIGLLIKSPIGKYVPVEVAEVIERVTPDQWRELINSVSAIRRQEFIIELIRTKLRVYGVEITEKTAEAIYTYAAGRMKVK